MRFCFMYSSELYEKAAGASPSPSFWGNAYLAQVGFLSVLIEVFGSY